MCGIVGYIGNKNATEILTQGLKRLEYRGYDSAGVAVFDGKEIQTVKAKGRLKNLKDELLKTPVTGNLGIGHTRWATHGAPCAKNSHPHTSQDGKIAVVHNGIIENYEQLRAMLENKGYTFKSETDTEVIPHLVELYYDGDIFCAVKKAVSHLSGSYALGIICENEPDKLVAVRKESPLIIGVGDGENFIASDIPAILSETENVYFLNDGEIAVITKDTVDIFGKDGEPVIKKPEKVTFSENAAQKDGYEHFMLKEIYEQPRAVADTLRGRLADGMPVKFDDFDSKLISKFRKIYIVACGTAYHAGLVGKMAIEKLAKLPTDVELASEFRYNEPLIDSETMVIAISQSGETADTLAGVRLAKSSGAYVLAITNVLGSSISREADMTFYTYAGPEISVASTKAYTTQLVALYLFALFLAENKNSALPTEIDIVKKELLKLPVSLKKVLELEGEIKRISKKIYKETDMYYLGRGLDYAVAMEGSLKLKEISYIHSETYAGGELKHGPIALIEKDTVVIAISTNKEICAKMDSNIKEVTTRGAYTIAIVNEATAPQHTACSHMVVMPGEGSVLSPVTSAIPLQLLAYHVAYQKGEAIDKPRNLAKSVTVE
ncbi:MAG: glutamine--fructose-6-phosphate transaminase (isomerizing) [Clostridia bacterium]|nr:glutamine--fructose-6-phosphate transaminase (isomerizing) [Clostridia bacterium]